MRTIFSKENEASLDSRTDSAQISAESEKPKMKFPKVIRHRKAEVTIYGKKPNYAFYRISYRSGGKRHLRNFSKYGDALKEAEKKVRELSDCEVTSKLLAAAATSWEPDWAGIFSNGSMKSRDWEQKPFVDWMVYVPRKIVSVPAPSNLTRLENGGSLIIVQPVPPILDNPQDLSRICEIEKIVRP